MQLKQPTTRKLPEEILERTKTYYGEPFEKLFQDEEFYESPEIHGVFASQYARLIKTDMETALLISPYYDAETGYTTWRETGTSHGLHRLVASVWLQKPDWLPDTYGLEHLEWWKILETHHLYKVKDNLQAQLVDVDWAVNLRWVYKKYHNMIDGIKEFKYRISGKSYRKARYVDEIADYYGCSEQKILELLMNKPTYSGTKWDYYTAEDGIDFAVKRYTK